MINAASSVSVLLLLAAAPVTSLTPAQQRVLEREFVCPAKLADDDARIAAVRQYMARYAAFAPQSSVAERMAFRDALLARKKCSEPDRDLIHTFPEL